MLDNWRWVATALVVPAGLFTGGCAGSAPDGRFPAPEARARTAAADSLLLAVDRTDYARDWLGRYRGLADVLGDDQRWDYSRSTALSIWYGRRTDDGRPTISILGESSRPNGTGSYFELIDLEVDGRKDAEGVVGGRRPRDDRLPRHRRKIEYSLSRNDGKIAGHIREYRGLTEYGPYQLQHEWIFEATKTDQTSYDPHRRRWE